MKGALVFSAITLAIAICGAMLAKALPLPPEAGSFEVLESGLFTLMIVLCAGSSWLGMMPSLRTKAVD